MTTTTGPVSALSPDELRALAEQAGRDLEGAHPADVLRWARDVFGSDLVLASSMGDEVLVDIAATAAPGIDVVFLDTGYHFAETIGTRDYYAEFTDVNLRTVLPLRTVAEQDAEHGPRLHERDPNLCCALRKVEPLERALAPYTAWVTGMRREDAPTRTDITVVGWDARRSKVKLNPLAAWTWDDVNAYVAEHHVVLNPLRELGYASIGCAPCTRAVAPGEDPRAGRWAGTNKTECGLHT
ncbi:phosphoadenosine phosphosulfate reductase [Cellulomonas flavigena DSM 20109]|uniref:Adenosine 5'-phosphosulfate reductase n=1 Tax=Cellulomonas flavigena (strain ATCC 482 / DSM 20109 / BCRC 11376 / JCM 18109 / NBRC 3775 / NCIMB 8073 / NRS 134) TaxID=446466 RepID=D5UEH4_CELFN|nr:phosphoadenylyl-sulfate reductase [Cellulomonas flavigena]ADG74634.1 phosphoadenosine phosphosulfate reductase [Cellulomonas flavigena DSM 20109]